MTIKLDNEIIYTENAESVPHEVWDNHFKSDIHDQIRIR